MAGKAKAKKSKTTKRTTQKRTSGKSRQNAEFNDMRSQIEAINSTQAVIEFNMDGTIIKANDNFLNVLGYTLAEIEGKHHSIFVLPEYKNSVEYRQFWDALNRGEVQSGEFRRIGKGGKEVWIQASYTPIRDTAGKVYKVVKYATDITERTNQANDMISQIEAINNTQAVIQFNMDGTIIKANDNFLNVVGYTLSEIQGNHHSIFVLPEYKNSVEYRQFWDALNRGEVQSGEFKRIGKGGKEVWIQASYTPIRDADGNVYKVVKYASDITAQKREIADALFRTNNIIKSVASPMFVVDKDLKINEINDQALKAGGYTREEVVGKMTCADFARTPLCGTSNCTIKNCMRTGDPIHGETEMTTRDGKKVPIMAACSGLFDKEGRPYGGMEVIMDQTEQKDTLKEVARLIGAAQEGQLNERASIGDSTGDYKMLRENLNNLLDAIVNPLQEASRVMAAAADKDLTKLVEGEYQGQFAELKKNINTSINNLNEALNAVATAVEQVASAGDQVSSGSQTLAQGANEQASSIEEVSSSLDEMDSKTTQNSENAESAKEESGNAQQAARKGTETMERMTDAINKIKQSSDETGKIVKTIDEIAFQTNLLALNAAVEAARAGEAGKGFAVVAEEVRNLAQRSAEAAKNTADMIEEAGKNAEGGVRITEEVGSQLVEIVKGSEKVDEVIAQIAEASKEQAEGIKQINQAIAQLDKATQQNAANSEESASAAEELNSQAEELQQMINEFQLRNSGRFEGRPTTQPVQKKRQKRPSNPQQQSHKKRVEMVNTSSSGGEEEFPMEEGDFGDF